MKVTSILFALAFGVFAVPAASEGTDDIDSAVLKRAADAAAKALAEAMPARDASNYFCHLGEGGCDKAKRAAFEVEAALAQARSVADEDHALDYIVKRSFTEADTYSLAVKRAANAAADALAEADPEAKNKFCHLAGEGCGKIKRDPKNKFCHLAGEGCGKVRRAADALASAFNDQLEQLY